MKTYLVTGGCGFIGSYVIEELLKRDDIACIYNIDKMGVGSSSDNISKDKRVINFFTIYATMILLLGDQTYSIKLIIFFIWQQSLMWIDLLITR